MKENKKERKSKGEKKGGGGGREEREGMMSYLGDPCFFSGSGAKCRNVVGLFTSFGICSFLLLFSFFFFFVYLVTILYCSDIVWSKDLSTYFFCFFLPILDQEFSFFLFLLSLPFLIGNFLSFCFPRARIDILTLVQGLW